MRLVSFAPPRAHILQHQIGPALLAIVLGAAFCSCVPRSVRIAAPCAGRDRAQTIGDLAALVSDERFSIKAIDADVGILQASSAEEVLYGGGSLERQWWFTMRGDTVFARAFTRAVTRNAHGVVTSTSESPYNDDAPQSHTWYWNVRRGLERLCGAPVVFQTE